ncbi:MAG: bifunctional oligoribonuclease/PAP phosphatase NrnA [Acidobacteria bacterium]|jgi:phosphoesterase RecJ-like protein|nr:bifunctional oligoribonuclease/PAP phosphatase NrnA [Acidobacteriota bacterium]
MSSSATPCRDVCDQLRRHQRIVVTSHVRPDGDAIGSALALAGALKAIGKDACVINRDPVPVPLTEFPGVSDIVVAETVPADTEALVVLECGDLERTGLGGLDHCVVINVDHHQGNTGYGNIRWFDATYAAVGEMVFEMIDELGAPVTPEMATQLFVAIVTDTGSFRYPGVSPRTFAMSGRLVAAGADPVLTARRLYDSNTLGRLRLQAAVLQSLDIQASGRLALLHLDDAMLAAAGAASEDTDGLINLPLSVKAIQAVVFFKHAGDGTYRVSFRSKGHIDVGAIARSFAGGGHKNASGCTIAGDLPHVRETVLARVVPELIAHPAAGRTSD